MKRGIVRYYFDVISGKRRDLFSFFVKCGLFILSVTYDFFVKIRYLFYSLGILKINKLDIPVVSVGNITLGGTGKTPTVIWLGKWLKEENRKIGILSRGYGRKRNDEIEVLSNSDNAIDYNLVGDEPLIIKNHLGSDVPVVVGSDRYKSGLLIQKNFKPDLVILDDGFQHISLARDLDIVVIDAVNPFGNKKIFPAGILRENLKNLRRADVFLITKTDLVPDSEIEKLEDFIAGIKPCAVIFKAIYEVIGLNSIQTNNIFSIKYYSGKRCLAFSGIGNPGGFLKTLENNNFGIIDYIVFPDHYSFKKEDVHEIFKKADELNADFVVTTEKDEIRLKNLIPLEKDVLICLVALKIVEGEEVLKEKIKDIFK